MQAPGNVARKFDVGFHEKSHPKVAFDFDPPTCLRRCVDQKLCWTPKS
jgi:hypothetical protein